MALRWYEFRSVMHGSITVKGRNEEEAREEAAERKGCDEDELLCVAVTPYYRKGVPPIPRTDQ